MTSRDVYCEMFASSPNSFGSSVFGANFTLLTVRGFGTRQALAPSGTKPWFVTVPRQNKLDNEGSTIVLSVSVV